MGTTTAITKWTDFYIDGERYLNVIQGGVNKPEKFTPDIIYNLACMTIEKFFMAYFILIEFLPYNHTLIDLVDSIKEKEYIPEYLEKRLLKMNEYQEICSIETYMRTIPQKEDVSLFIESTVMTKKYIDVLIQKHKE